MLSGVSLVVPAIDPVPWNVPSRVDIDRFRILLVAHCNTLPLGRMRGWKLSRLIRRVRVQIHVSRA